MVINCKEIVDEMKVKIKEEASKLENAPQLATILVGNDSASKIYVSNKEKFIAECGMNSFTMGLEETTTEELIELIEVFNNDNSVNGILVQLPLPSHIDTSKVISSINPLKDVDGFTSSSPFTPCTPKGVCSMLKHIQYEVSGKHILLLGRSNIVGNPLYKLLLDNDATIIQLHSKTPFKAPAYVYNMQPQVIISAVGKQGLIKSDMLQRIKEMSGYSPELIIDIGINRTENGVEGDISKTDYKQLDELGIQYTSVPGGVGLLTVANLAENLIEAYKLQNPK